MTIVRPYGDTTGDGIRERSQPKGSGSQPQRDRTAEQVTNRRTTSPSATGMNSELLEARS